jgi:large conductance mechanosensitive channel
VPKILSDFKKFIERGNVVDLAVAVILGIAFGLVVKAMTEKILMPLISVITGGEGPNFDYSLTLRGKEILWGSFLTEVVNFLIIAFAVFLIVKAIEKAKNLRHHADADKEIKLTELDVLEEIRDILAAQQRREARRTGETREALTGESASSVRE